MKRYVAILVLGITALPSCNPEWLHPEKQPIVVAPAPEVAEIVPLTEEEFDDLQEELKTPVQPAAAQRVMPQPAACPTGTCGVRYVQPARIQPQYQSPPARRFRPLKALLGR
jgi:hypothetical protein